MIFDGKEFLDVKEIERRFWEGIKICVYRKNTLQDTNVYQQKHVSQWKKH